MNVHRNTVGPNFRWIASVFTATRDRFGVLAPLLLIIWAPQASNADAVHFIWDSVTDARVAVYQLWYGTKSGQYDQYVETATNAATIDGLEIGQTYYFAVRACAALRSRCSAYSKELEITELVDVHRADSGTLFRYGQGFRDEKVVWYFWYRGDDKIIWYDWVLSDGAFVRHEKKLYNGDTDSAVKISPAAVVNMIMLLLFSEP